MSQVKVDGAWHDTVGQTHLLIAQRGDVVFLAGTSASNGTGTGADSRPAALTDQIQQADTACRQKGC